METSMAIISLYSVYSCYDLTLRTEGFKPSSGKNKRLSDAPFPEFCV